MAYVPECPQFEKKKNYIYNPKSGLPVLYLEPVPECPLFEKIINYIYKPRQGHPRSVFRDSYVPKTSEANARYWGNPWAEKRVRQKQESNVLPQREQSQNSTAHGNPPAKNHSAQNGALNARNREVNNNGALS